MSAIHHGRCFGLGLLCCVALALLASPVRGQPRVDIVTALLDVPAVRQLEAIRESLQAKDWETAVRAMQKLLDLPEDRLIAVKERQADKTASRVVSVRTECCGSWPGCRRTASGSTREPLASRRKSC